MQYLDYDELISLHVTALAQLSTPLSDAWSIRTDMCLFENVFTEGVRTPDC